MGTHEGPRLEREGEMRAMMHHALKVSGGAGSIVVEQLSKKVKGLMDVDNSCLLYTSPSPRDLH